MSDPTQLSFAELFWFLLLVGLFLNDLLRAFSSRDPLAVYQPPIFVMAFMAYYCLIGPIQRLISNDWLYRSLDFRALAVYGWAGAAVFYASLSVGYATFRHWRPARRFSPPFDERRSARLGGLLCLSGFLLYLVPTGPRAFALMNPFGASSSSLFYVGGLNVGPFTNYFTSAINLLIPGVLLLFAAWIRRRGSPIGWILWMLVAMALFSSLGFRWRIVSLLVPMVILWFLARSKRPSLPVLGLCAVGLLALAGFIGITRTYGAGLTVQEGQEFSLEQLLLAGLDESSIFLTTSGIISSAPDSQPFVGLQPIISTLLFPVPADFLGGLKNSAEYLIAALRSFYQQPVLAVGDAILNYAEYYLMFGWFSLVLMGVLSGWLLRCLWEWFSLRRHETLAQVAYVATCGLLYVWVSRGYMPQVALTFAFGSLPLFWLYYRQARPVRSLIARPEGPKPQTPVV